MRLIRAYHIQKNNETVVVTDEGEFPIWTRDFEKYFAHLTPGDARFDSELLVDLAVRREVKKSAIRRLTMGDITKRDLYKRLMSKKVYTRTPDPSFLEELLDKLERAGYINDGAYAERYLQKCLEKSWGKHKIRAAMYEKGFSAETVDSVLSECHVDFSEMAYALITEKYPDTDRDTVYRRLLARGFSSEEITLALERIEN